LAPVNGFAKKIVMRIFNSSLLFAAVLCFSLSVRADDNAAQTAARAALMQKMQELDSATNNPAPPPSTPAPAPENQTPATPVAPENPAPQPATESSPAPQNVSPAETPSTPAPETSTPAETSAPVPADVAPQTQPAPVETETTPITAPVAAPTNEVSPEAEEQVIIEQRQAQLAQPPTMITNASPVMNEMAVLPSPSPVVMPAPQKNPGFFSHILHPFRRTGQPTVVEEQRVQPAAPEKNNPGFAPIEPPPVPVSPEQEAQLQDLLQKYKADQITPDEYQAQRAAIIGPR
jgi:hypothetical protein